MFNMDEDFVQNSGHALSIAQWQALSRNAARHPAVELYSFLFQLDAHEFSDASRLCAPEQARHAVQTEPMASHHAFLRTQA